MTQPSNSNLIGPGQIILTPDVKRRTLALEVHFVTIHLTPDEAAQLVSKLIEKGSEAYGVGWREEIRA